MARQSSAALLALFQIWVIGAAVAQEPPAMGALVASEILGSFVTGPFTIEELTLMNPDLIKNDLCDNTGTWVMDVRGGGWSLNNWPVPGCRGWNPAVLGSWRILPGRVLAIRELRDTGCGLAEYTYAWHLLGDELTFEVVNDPCTPRIYIFTAHVWHKVPDGAQPQFR